MDPQAFLDISTAVTKLRMYPYFDIANYILMCIIVREDNPVLPGKFASHNHTAIQWVLRGYGVSLLINAVTNRRIIVPPPPPFPSTVSDK